jgi:DNA-binding transcriptional regulator YdaS (Cro superfamily)
MCKETLQKAVDLAGGQTALAREIRGQVPESKVSQVHVWNWLNASHAPVPPADMVLPISRALAFQVTPHELRPDLYPHPLDGMPREGTCACSETPPAVQAAAA